MHNRHLYHHGISVVDALTRWEISQHLIPFCKSLDYSLNYTTLLRFVVYNFPFMYSPKNGSPSATNFEATTFFLPDRRKTVTCRLHFIPPLSHIIWGQELHLHLHGRFFSGRNKIGMIAENTSLLVPYIKDEWEIPPGTGRWQVAVHNAYCWVQILWELWILFSQKCQTSI